MPRTLLVVLLVLLVLLMAIPLGTGMALGMCSTQHSSVCPSAVGSCAAIVGLIVILVVGILGVFRHDAVPVPLLLLALPIERPPRHSSL